MKPTICICCGEPMVEHGNALSRNPNICASCSSLADGMDEFDSLGLESAILSESSTGEQTAARGQKPATIAALRADD